MAEQLILKSNLPPGDMLTMTAAVKSLHDIYPNQYITDVQSFHPDIWINNPNIKKVDPKVAKVLDLEYPIINSSSNIAVTFLEGYMRDLSEKLGVRLHLTTNKPLIYLSEEEKKPPEGLPLQYVVFMAGTKKDYQAKQWPIEYYQEVVNKLKNRIAFVQFGKSSDKHHEIKGAINLIDKTPHLRQMFQICNNAVAGLCPVTLLQHVMAGLDKPCVTLVGGREGLPWVSAYPKQVTIHRIGSSLPCCKKQACWKSRVVPSHDGTKLDHKDQMCRLPVTDLIEPVGKCMLDITPEEVIRHLETYL